MNSSPGLRTIPYRLKRRPEERVTLLGAEVDLVRPEEMLLFVAARIRAQLTTIVANHNLDSLCLVRQQPEMKAFYHAADLVEVDSMPMILWGRLLGLPIRGFHRCTYQDWRADFWRTAGKERWRVFYLGGAPGVAEAGADRVRREFHATEIDGHHGYFDMTPGSADQEAVMTRITAFAPDVILVGMGMPRQEIWIQRNAQFLSGVALFSVGAAFDYEAGVQRAAPRWMGRVGLEWLFPLVSDPVRLSGRYLVAPWSLASQAVVDVRQALVRRRPVKPAPALRAEP